MIERICIIKIVILKIVINKEEPTAFDTSISTDSRRKCMFYHYRPFGLLDLCHLSELLAGPPSQPRKEGIYVIRSYGQKSNQAQLPYNYVKTTNLRCLLYFEVRK